MIAGGEVLPFPSRKEEGDEEEQSLAAHGATTLEDYAAELRATAAELLIECLALGEAALSAGVIPSTRSVALAHKVNETAAWMGKEARDIRAEIGRQK